jgi:hypothetical protein
LIGLSPQTNDRIETLRPAEDVREPFLGDPKKMSLRFERQAPNVRPFFERDVDAAPLHQVCDVPLQTHGETELILYRRVQFT